MKPAALLIPVPNVKVGVDWYLKAFPKAKPRYLPDFDFTVLDIGDFAIEVVQADDKVNAGKQGVVMYWQVPCLDDAMIHFRSLGAKLYRGPLAIEDDLYMCQFEDPFGNLIGLRGK
ncbi:glyoxalase/bleomycin resistance/dioxygenase family protein [Vibrio sp. SCSIO 43136]|uniref:glyoxalase/bleomycin resistance/dioxygenase family protein n=1 Tax=Vibrio sp. SCSIO 43136 TaxID=2819101 RepID=UPI0020750212|nr:glyoxalase/bleomycin resistance/dioxygenase family protein [Vibrio sp. SCSIO 43136]USD67427.1 glyoxalase/bleomycin resistance/dioxygenase family protein [Vibrio sp. SCSIO 43136]